MASLRHKLLVKRPCTRYTATMEGITNGECGEMRNIPDRFLARTTVKKLLIDASLLTRPCHKDKNNNTGACIFSNIIEFFSPMGCIS